MSPGSLKRLIGRSALSIAVFASVLYTLDYLSLKFQFPGGRAQLGVVHVEPYLAIPQKNGKVEFMEGDPVDRSCVHAVFPHFGDPPCWYLEKHKRPRVDM